MTVNNQNTYTKLNFNLVTYWQTLLEKMERKDSNEKYIMNLKNKYKNDFKSKSFPFLYFYFNILKSDRL